MLSGTTVLAIISGTFLGYMFASKSIADLILTMLIYTLLSIVFIVGMYELFEEAK